MMGKPDPYYSGGVRVIVDGVPIRLARKPSKSNLADLREYEKDRAKPWDENRAEKAERIAAEARREISVYAEMLGIDEETARQKIGFQREHVIANPLVDLSWDYDL